MDRTPDNVRHVPQSSSSSLASWNEPVNASHSASLSIWGETAQGPVSYNRPPQVDHTMSFAFPQGSNTEYSPSAASVEYRREPPRNMRPMPLETIAEIIQAKRNRNAQLTRTLSDLETEVRYLRRGGGGGGGRPPNKEGEVTAAPAHDNFNVERINVPSSLGFGSGSPLPDETKTTKPTKKRERSEDLEPPSLTACIALFFLMANHTFQNCRLFWFISQSNPQAAIINIPAAEKLYSCFLGSGVPGSKLLFQKIVQVIFQTASQEPTENEKRTAATQYGLLYEPKITPKNQAPEWIRFFTTPLLISLLKPSIDQLLMSGELSNMVAWYNKDSCETYEPNKMCRVYFNTASYLTRSTNKDKLAAAMESAQLPLRTAWSTQKINDEWVQVIAYIKSLENSFPLDIRQYFFRPGEKPSEPHLIKGSFITDNPVGQVDTRLKYSQLLPGRGTKKAR